MLKLIREVVPVHKNKSKESKSTHASISVSNGKPNNDTESLIHKVSSISASASASVSASASPEMPAPINSMAPPLPAQTCVPITPGSASVAPIPPPRPQPKSAIQSHPYLNTYQTPPPPQPLQLQIHQKHLRQQMAIQKSMNRCRPTQSPPPPPTTVLTNRPLPSSTNVSPDPSSGESAVCLSGTEESTHASGASSPASNVKPQSLWQNDYLCANAIDIDIDIDAINKEPESVYHTIDANDVLFDCDVAPQVHRSALPHSTCPAGHAPSDADHDVQFGLPVKFVTALRQLFDVFDDQKCGLVCIQELKRRFECSQDQPPELLQCLQLAANSQGQVDFGAFCKGIRDCLLRSQVNRHNDLEPVDMSLVNDANITANTTIDTTINNHNNNNSLTDCVDHHSLITSGNGGYANTAHVTPNKFEQIGLPLVDSACANASSVQFAVIGSASHVPGSNVNVNGNTDTSAPGADTFGRLSVCPSVDKLNGNVRPMVALRHRPSSVPIDQRWAGNSTSTLNLNHTPAADHVSTYQHVSGIHSKSVGPLANCLYAELRSRAAVGSSDDLLDEQRRSQIMTRLVDWRADMIKRGRSADGRFNDRLGNNSRPEVNFGQTNGHDNGTCGIVSSTTVTNGNGLLDSNGEPLYSVIEKRMPARKRETRRHTVTNTSELQAIKTLQQLEQQKEMLIQGAEMVNKASVWYRRQIQMVDHQIVARKCGSGHMWTSSGNNLSAAFAGTHRHVADVQTEGQHMLSVITSKVLHINCQLRSLMQTDFACNAPLNRSQCNQFKIN